jgi:polysaccharide export outer membrane protein
VWPLDHDRGGFGSLDRIYRKADHLLVFSEFARTELLRREPRAGGRIAAAYLGVEDDGRALPSKAQARERLGMAPDERAILCIGHIKKNKDLPTLLRSFATVAGRDPAARLYIVGRPTKCDPAPAQELARELNLRDRALFKLESVPEDEMDLWYRACDAVVLPYTRLYQSAVLTQACIHRRAVVATAVGSIPELVLHGETGWVVPAGDSGALASALGECIEDPEESARRANACFERLSRLCRWDRISQQILSMLKNSGARTLQGATGRLAPSALALASLVLAGTATSCRSPRSSEPVTARTEIVHSSSRYRKEYAVAPGDTLEVVVRQNASISRTYVVRPDGNITIPMLDDVHVAGLTFGQVKTRLTELLSKRMRDPEVTVIASNIRQPMVLVVGEVAQQGAVEFRSATTAAQAIARAGGMKDSSNRDAVAVIRLDDEGRLVAITIDTTVSGQPGPYLALQNFPLEPDDIVLVPKSGIAQIDQWITEFVNQPLSGVNAVLGTYTNYKLIEFVTRQN